MPGETETVMLVDAHDVEVGTAGKRDAHEQGLLHRALSVFVFDRGGRLLLQRRAAGKYHSAGLWANTCCSHPRPHESVPAAARRRLREEMGFECDLRWVFYFVYRAEVGDGMIEHELDHVFVGRYDADPAPDPAEVQAWRWVTPNELGIALQDHPERHSAWLPIAVRELVARSLWPVPGGV